MKFVVEFFPPKKEKRKKVEKWKEESIGQNYIMRFGKTFLKVCLLKPAEE